MTISSQNAPNRILSTHIGSLPRPSSLVETMRAIEARKPYDQEKYDREVADAVSDSVHWQCAMGLDIVSDGEMGRINFINYVNARLSGFEEPALGSIPAQWAKSRETIAFPAFYAWLDALNSGVPVPRRMTLVCKGPLTYVGGERLAQDIATLKLALAGQEVMGAFMPAISPATIAGYHRNEYYKSDEEFLFAIAEAMRCEYRSIVEAGLILQIDDPRLVTHHLRNPDLTLDEWQTWAAVRVEALNHALAGLPEERIRHHTCYGINMGPRVSDLEMKHIVGLITKIRAGAYSFEAANPRHEHEWEVWRTSALRDDKVLIPGLVTHSTYVVEHPELVADRIRRFASVVGRDRVIAGTDCGFASSATAEELHPTIVEAKLQALVAGAKLASDQLWSH
ncbi:MAG: cobalamin-independent methionine synthase II family protein [Alphaproteobacteria bacterium]|nr:cobalamin-independent methionine synthase II family protein [Alphaproteobacteria bacterium]